MEAIIAAVIELNEIYPATSGSSEENMNNFTSFPHLCLLYSNYDVMEDISMLWTWWLTQGSWEIGLVRWARHIDQLNQLSFFSKLLNTAMTLWWETVSYTWTHLGGQIFHDTLQELNACFSIQLYKKEVLHLYI